MRALALLLALAPVPALAQAYQCAPPRGIEPFAPIVPEEPARRTATSGYTLAATWTPDRCKTTRDTTSLQCSGDNGRFGFILHGLWPEAADGRYPRWCSMKPVPSPQLLRRNFCMTPSARLLAHEWAKHGSCMSKTPEQYFKASQALWRAIQWPDADRLSRKAGLTAGDLRRAFVVANPSWNSDQIGILVSRTGWLKEVRLCYSRRFLPTKCGRVQAGPPDSAPLKIWRGL